MYESGCKLKCRTIFVGNIPHGILTKYEKRFIRYKMKKSTYDLRKTRFYYRSIG
jgi:hypothetical protein